MNTLERIKQQGNLFQLLMDKSTPVHLLRVWGYESKVGNAYLNFLSRYGADDEEMQALVDVLKELRNSMNTKTIWNDNKIVMEIEVDNHRIFIGYWDEYISVGGSVIPNIRPPKYMMGQFMGIDKIPLR